MHRIAELLMLITAALAGLTAASLAFLLLAARLRRDQLRPANRNKEKHPWL